MSSDLGAVTDPSESARDLKFSELFTLLGAEDDSAISSIVFDTNEELLWAGNEEGYVTSFYGPQLKKYTCFRAHSTEPVRSLITTDAGVFTITKTSLKHHIRRGLPKFSFQSQNMMNMQCLIAMDENRIVMGGCQDILIDLDVNTRQERIQHVLDDEDTKSTVLKKHSDFLVSGDPAGQIVLRDPVSLDPEHIIHLESTALIDLDVIDNLAAVCGSGTSNKVLVFDIRTLQSLSSIEIPFEPVRLKFLPSIPNRLAVLSNDGIVQIVNPQISEQNSLITFQVNSRMAKCTSFDISSTSQAIGIADDSGSLHLFSDAQNKEPKYNECSRDTEFPDKIEDIPYASYNEKLFRQIAAKAPLFVTANEATNNFPVMFGPHIARYLESRNSETVPQDDDVSVVSN